uniref:Uncharacterized protein n=2 Tax=Meloidogyne enterolobii TaxID=390850 RepID=A0A6V7YCS1_MELEN|nr:unnamed protein product [Meloidogyne enterolobii]
MKMRTPEQIEDWSYSNNNSDNINNYLNKIEDDSDKTINSSDRTIQLEKELNQEPKPINIILERNCCSYKQHIFYGFVILLSIVVIVVTSQNKGNEEKLHEKIEKIDKEQAKLYEQIKILEDAKTDLDNLVRQTSENFREKIAFIGDKQKEIIYYLNNASETNFYSQNFIRSRMDRIETKQSIENKEFEIKLHEMKIEIDKMIKEFTSDNRENEENKTEILKMGKQIYGIVEEQENFENKNYSETPNPVLKENKTDSASLFNLKNSIFAEYNMFGLFLIIYYSIALLSFLMVLFNAKTEDFFTFEFFELLLLKTNISAFLTTLSLFLFFYLFYGFYLSFYYSLVYSYLIVYNFFVYYYLYLHFLWSFFFYLISE